MRSANGIGNTRCRLKHFWDAVLSAGRKAGAEIEFEADRDVFRGAWDRAYASPEDEARDESSGGAQRRAERDAWNPACREASSRRIAWCRPRSAGDSVCVPHSVKCRQKQEAKPSGAETLLYFPKRMMHHAGVIGESGRAISENYH